MFKFNITPEDCEFIIKEDERKIICILNNTKYLFYDFICNNCKIELFYRMKFSNRLYNETLMPNRFTGIATCSPNDDWNIEIGKFIAFSRMKDKVSRSFFKHANSYFNTLDKWLDEAAILINQIGGKLERNQQRRHDYIKLLIGEDPDGQQNSSTN